MHDEPPHTVDRDRRAERLSELATLIMAHKRRYYQGLPGISDPEYDALEDELRALAPDHPALLAVGGEVAADLPKVAHAEPMLSLQKTYQVKELEAWQGEEEVVGTLKVDGVSLSLIFHEGLFTLAKTRGDGLVGEDVSAKARWVSDIPKQLSGTASTKRPLPTPLEVRGELYCTESNFLKLSETMVSLGLPQPVSPRNIVSGILGRKTHGDLARFFSFFAFGVVDPGKLELATEVEQFQWLGARGFRLPFPERLNKPADVAAYLESTRRLMEDDEIPIDGAVFSFNVFARQRALGSTSHHPRYKMSFKWQGETAMARVVALTWATSRLGVVTPVAVIEPVSLSGAMISNVTLHNAACVRAYNLKVGDLIEVVRSGEVIPKFLQVVTPGAGQYQWPPACPSCATPLDFDGVRLRCPNQQGCGAQQLGTILAWIKAVGIDDLSEKRLLPLMAAGKVRTIPDLYRLEIDDFYAVPLIKEKMATKLKAHIDQSRTLPLGRFLNGLGIEGTGLTTWEKLLEEFPSLAALQAATGEQIAAIDGFAAKTAAQIVTGLQMRRDLIAELQAVGVEPTAVSPVRGEGGPLAGHTLVITGALSRPRAEIEKQIKAAGGKVGSAVSKTTYAVITEEPDAQTTKMQKARALGVPIWREADLYKILGV